jgi:spore coat protein U-like protein
MTMRMKVIAPIATGILLVAAGSAAADTKTTTFAVNAAVAANCNVTAAPLAFGSFDATAPLTSSTNIKVRCSSGTPYAVKLSAGAGTFAQRQLSNGTSKLNYNLFTTDALISIWGDGSDSTVFPSGNGTGLSAAQEKTHTVYGQLPNSVANQDAPVGSYADTITVTVEY